MARSVTICFQFFLACLLMMPEGLGRPPKLAHKIHIEACIKFVGSYYNTSSGFICCSCYAGQHWTEDCRQNYPKTTKCKPCINNGTLQTFTQVANSYPMCNISKSESVCDSLMYTELQAGNSTVDNKCVCIIGTYASDPELNGCRKFTKCLPGFEPQVEGDSTHDVQCKRCSGGMCSYEKSSTEKCVLCKKTVTVSDSTEASPETSKTEARESDNTVTIVLVVIAALVVVVLVGGGCIYKICQTARRRNEHSIALNVGTVANGKDEASTDNGTRIQFTKQTSNQELGSKEKRSHRPDTDLERKPNSAVDDNDDEGESMKPLLTQPEKPTTPRTLHENPKPEVGDGSLRCNSTESSTPQTTSPPHNNALHHSSETLPEVCPDDQVPAALPSAEPSREEEPLMNDSDRQFEQDLEVFCYTEDKEKLKQMNRPNDVHNALSSWKCLQEMCNDFATNFEKANLEEFLLTNRLVDKVRIGDINGEKSKDYRALKRALLDEMCAEQGEKLNPKILLTLARGFRLRVMYDDLCKSFLNFLDPTLT